MGCHITLTQVIGGEHQLLPRLPTTYYLPFFPRRQLHQQPSTPSPCAVFWAPYVVAVHYSLPPSLVHRGHPLSPAPSALFPLFPYVFVGPLAVEILPLGVPLLGVCRLLVLDIYIYMSFFLADHIHPLVLLLLLLLLLLLPQQLGVAAQREAAGARGGGRAHRLGQAAARSDAGAHPLARRRRSGCRRRCTSRAAASNEGAPSTGGACSTTSAGADCAEQLGAERFAWYCMASVRPCEPGSCTFFSLAYGGTRSCLPPHSYRQ